MEFVFPQTATLPKNRNRETGFDENECRLGEKHASFDCRSGHAVPLMKEAADPGLGKGHVVFVASFNDGRGPQ